MVCLWQVLTLRLPIDQSRLEVTSGGIKVLLGNFLTMIGFNTCWILDCVLDLDVLLLFSQPSVIVLFE